MSKLKKLKENPEIRSICEQNERKELFKKVALKLICSEEWGANVEYNNKYMCAQIANRCEVILKAAERFAEGKE